MIKNVAPPTGIPKHCPVCRLALVKRTGRFGEFMCCPASVKGDNHGTWMLKPKRPTAAPHDSGLGYAHKRPDPEPEPRVSIRRYQPRQHESLRELVEFENGLMADPDLRFLQVTAGVAAELASLRGGPHTDRDVFLDPLGIADYAIASAIHDGQYDDELDDPLSGCRMVGMPMF